MKKRWIYMTVLVGLLTLAVTGGVAAAHNGGNGDNGPGDVTARAAEILDIDPVTLGDALKQAREEAMIERLQTRLDRMVDSGAITQEQADEYFDWIQARPDGPGLGFGQGGRGFGEMKHGSRGPGQHPQHSQGDPVPAPTSLEDAV